MKARAARRYHRRMNPEHGLVFFAQIAVDSSRIKNGEIIDDSYIIQSLERMLDEVKPKNLYLKHHPTKRCLLLSPAPWKMKGKVIPTETYDLLSIAGCASAHSLLAFVMKPRTLVANQQSSCQTLSFSQSSARRLRLANIIFSQATLSTNASGTMY